MRVEEAKCIKGALDKLNSQLLSPCINLGSSTDTFRRVNKPHINEYLIQPLLDNNIDVVHADLKMDSGVDIAGDIFEKSVQEQLRNVVPKLILCCNMFEHIKDRKALAKIIDSLLEKGGYLIVSVPYSYPLHYDPIDTYYRPSPSELALLFPGFDVKYEQIVTSTSYLRDVFKSDMVKHDLFKLLKKMMTFFYPFFKKNEWKRRHHRLFWLFRRYKVSIVLLKKVA